VTRLLAVEGLGVRYGGSVRALHGVTLAVERAEAVALLGANGAGKTTLLRAIGGLLGFHRGTITEGAIHFDGQPLKGDPARRVATGLGQTLEGRRMFAELSVAENLALGAFPRRARAEAPATRDAVLRLFPRLEQRLAQPAGTLSGGEQQMLAIGRALMSRPQLLILDEPSLGLAPLVVAEIADALRAVADDGTAILLVDQNTALALRVTQRAYLLEAGRVEAGGATSTLLLDGTVRAAYLGTAAGQAAVAAEAQA
jgi:branched-chain amino acid transport system ATP-binding protein